jgi:hypothetical protein
MTTSRVLTMIVAGSLWLVAACSASGGETAEIETTPMTDASEVTETTTTRVTTTTAPPTTITTEPIVDPPPDDWAEQLIAAFATYDQRREELDDEMSRQLGEEPPQTEQDYYNILADMLVGMADAGGTLTASVPPSVPPDVAPSFGATMRAHQAHVDQLRAAATGLLEGDVGPENERQPLLDSFNTACADLQFTLLDLGAGQLACSIRGEDTETRAFVESPTVDFADEQPVEMPAGEYELDYIISDNPENPNPDLVIGLAYEQDRLIRTSITVLEIADPEEGPSIRLFTNELVASPLDLAPDRIRDFWFNTDGPEGWIGALAGVTVVETGDGEISGSPAEYWVLVSELDAPIAVLGDGDGWVPETTLDPGQPVRLWSVILDGHPLILTEHVPNGATLDEFTDELEALRAGLTLSIG